MALRALRFLGDPVLEQVAAPVNAFDDGLAALVSDMFETMYAAPGRGLAAPQIGLSKRVFVVDTAWKDGAPKPMVFINPRITASADAQGTGEEACLSIPDRRFAVARPAWVEMVWQDTQGAQHEGRFAGVAAICICHEADHLEGRLITETGTEL